MMRTLLSRTVLCCNSMHQAFENVSERRKSADENYNGSADLDENWCFSVSQSCLSHVAN